jgi:acetoin utilization protein AcuB
MLVKDIMAQKVVSIPSTTSIADAKRIMNEKNIRRLPVVDNGKLVGIVTEHGLESYLPSKVSSLSIWELGYLLGNTSVEKVMEKDLVTVSPDMFIEEALTLAQERKVGSLLVVKEEKLLGVVTTNDFFYKVVNPVLGIGLGGTRLEVVGTGDEPVLEDVINLANRMRFHIVTLHLIETPKSPEGKKDLVIHLDTTDVTKMVEELEKKGYQTIIRSCKVC